MSQKMLKKASPKTIMGRAIKAPDGDKPEHLFTIYGKANKTVRGESTYGPWVALVGEFEGMTVEGVEFASPKAFLPEPMHSMIAERLEDEDSSAVEFAIKVSIIKSDSTVGYEYQGEPLVEPEKSDSLSHLRNAAADALTAPTKGGSKKKAAEAEAETETE